MYTNGGGTVESWHPLFALIESPHPPHGVDGQQQGSAGERRLEPRQLAAGPPDMGTTEQWSSPCPCSLTCGASPLSAQAPPVATMGSPTLGAGWCLLGALTMLASGGRHAVCAPAAATMWCCRQRRTPTLVAAGHLTALIILLGLTVYCRQAWNSPSGQQRPLQHTTAFARRASQSVGGAGAASARGLCSAGGHAGVRAPLHRPASWSLRACTARVGCCGVTPRVWRL